VQVWACDAGVSSKPPTDLVWKSHSSWGAGVDVQVGLVNPQGEVRPPAALLLWRVGSLVRFNVCVCVAECGKENHNIQDGN